MGRSATVYDDIQAMSSREKRHCGALGFGRQAERRVVLGGGDERVVNGGYCDRW